MAPRRPTSQPEPPQLTVEQKRNRITRLERCIADLAAFDPSTVQKRVGVTEVLVIQASIEGALAAAFGEGTPTFKRYEDAARLDQGPHVLRTPSAVWGGGFIDYAAEEAKEARQYLTEGKDRSIALLRSAIRTLEDEIADEAPPTPPISASQGEHKSKIFVVHGHDEAAKHEVARFLDHIELKAIILSEQPSRGMTIIEKFVSSADEVAFAVVLLTPVDIATAIATAVEEQRARQNVIFELGYFVGKLGRGSVCLLRKGNVDMPSDLYGVVYSSLDSGGWKIDLGRELLAAGLKFDANKMFQ